MAKGSWLLEHRRTHRQPYAISDQLLAIDGDRNRSSSSLGDLRDRDAQLAVGQRGVGFGYVARPSKADRAREAPVAALDEMEARLPPRAARRFFSGDQDAVALADDADRGRIDARQIDRDLQAVVGFVDI